MLTAKPNGLEKKQLRKFRHNCRKANAKIEAVIRTSASSPIKVRDHALDADRMHDTARREMGIRIKLTTMWHNGNTQAGKRRRQLNDWELATDPAGPVEAWQEDSKHRPKTGGRRATGKCDVDAVKSLNKAKRGY